MLRINKLIRKFSTLEPHKWMMTSLGFKPNSLVFNPTIPELYEIAIAKKQSQESQVKTSDVSSNGAFCAYSTQNYAQAAQNYKIVKDAQTEATVNWNKFNSPIDEMSFSLAEELAVEYLDHKGNCIVVDGYAGWDPSARLKVRTFCGRSNHALFMRNMLIKPTSKQLLQDFSKGVDVNIFNASELVPAKFISGVESEQVTALNMKEKKIAILGNQSSQQMKKALFKIFQYYYPRKNILPLHGSATIEKNGKTTLFFGLEDTEKSSFGLISSNRKLIGLDELAWGDNGIFNIQGGCYTKILNNNQKVDSQVQNSIRYGTLVQNAIFYPNSRNINFYDIKQSPNAKTSFPLNFMKNAQLPSIGASPSNIVLFTCDTMGVLPPIAKLTPEQALYHFISGYSCTLDERDKYDTIKAPVAKFNACFGQEYLTLSPLTYGKMLYDKIKANNSNVWIINTGWTEGKYGQGVRINSEDIQKIINLVLQSKLEQIYTYEFPYFNFKVPIQLQGLNENLFYPERGWGIRSEFDEQISKLALLFTENYYRKFKGKIREIDRIAQQGAPTLI